MKKSAYILGLFGSIILFFILLSSLILNYSYNITIYNFIFVIELISIIIYLVLLNMKYWHRKAVTREHRLLFKILSIWVILILPFNLFWANFRKENLMLSILEFFFGLVRSVPNYIVIIPLLISFYIINRNNSRKNRNFKIG